MSNIEEWKSVIENAPHILVNRMGLVKSMNFHRSGKEKLRKTPKDTAGYCYVSVCVDGKYKNYSIHRLVAMAFIPNPENLPDVNHINGIKHDSRIENLEWCTKSENALHAIRTGLKQPQKGESHGMSKLTAEDVLDIRTKHSEKTHTMAELSRLYSVGFMQISRIIKRERWKHI